MAILAPVDKPAMELYLRRFCTLKAKHNLLTTKRFYAQLFDLCDIEWAVRSNGRVLIDVEMTPIDRLTSAHFDLIYANSKGWEHLMVWFPPLRPFCDGDEVRLVERAGVTLYAPIVTYG